MIPDAAIATMAFEICWTCLLTTGLITTSRKLCPSGTLAAKSSKPTILHNPSRRSRLPDSDGSLTATDVF
jgi:hypothetical protein